jgi:hypothetical protein
LHIYTFNLRAVLKKAKKLKIKKIEGTRIGAIFTTLHFPHNLQIGPIS